MSINEYKRILSETSNVPLELIITYIGDEQLGFNKYRNLIKPTK